MTDHANVITSPDRNAVRLRPSPPDKGAYAGYFVPSNSSGVFAGVYSSSSSLEISG
jgi:hypothetical protein